jgi:hypothetical protein
MRWCSLDGSFFGRGYLGLTVVRYLRVLFLCLSSGRSLILVACVFLFPEFVRGSALLDWRVYMHMVHKVLSIPTIPFMYHYRKHI